MLVARLISLLIAAALCGCGGAAGKADPFADRKQDLVFSECPKGYNPIPLSREDGSLPVPDVNAIPVGGYDVVATRIHFLIQSRKLTGVTYIDHATGDSARIVCTNFGLNDRFGYVFPGFGRWERGAVELVLGRTFTFLWNRGVASVSVEQDQSVEEPALSSVLRFFQRVNVYKLGEGRYDIRGERLELIGDKRFRTGASYEIQQR